MRSLMVLLCVGFLMRSAQSASNSSPGSNSGLGFSANSCSDARGVPGSLG